MKNHLNFLTAPDAQPKRHPEIAVAMVTVTLNFLSLRHVYMARGPNDGFTPMSSEKEARIDYRPSVIGYI